MSYTAVSPSSSVIYTPDEKECLRRPESFEQYHEAESGEEGDDLLHRLERSEGIGKTRDEEGQAMPEAVKKPSRLMTWIAVNILATIGIVSYCRSYA